MKTPILILLEVFSSSRLCYHWLYVFNSMLCYHSLYLFAMVGYIQQHVMLTIAVFIYLLLHVNKLLIIACYLSWCVMNNQI